MPTLARTADSPQEGFPRHGGRPALLENQSLHDVMAPVGVVEIRVWVSGWMRAAGVMVG